MRLGDDRHLGLGEPDAWIGTRIGSFTLVCSLGEGSRGPVYLAEHTVLETRRAVKLLSPLLTRNAGAVQRFVHDARAAAQLHHRNLIQVHDVGQVEGGTWFMVLDYLDGGTLGQLMASHVGPMAPDQVVHIVSEIGNGLQVAHDHGILHRDLRPENVFLVFREGDPHHVVLLDFGVAQLGDDPATWPEPPGCPTSGHRPRTLAYMAPEQLRRARLTPAVDVFALGVIAYQMTTGGWFPHQYGESRTGYRELPATELYHRQLSGPPVDPRERFRGLSAPWAEAILAAISADPARRPASVRSFVLGLAEALPGSGSIPGGRAIVRTYARELIDAGAQLDTARTPSLVAVAPTVGSRYQLGDKLGIGGMAEVFSATMIGAEGFARRVAIKRVLSGLSKVPAFATMFVAEAQIASRLAHPNIVSVLDFARDAEDRLYLVMEYVDGKDLASLLATGAISPGLTIFIMVELLRGLGYAHDLPDGPGDDAPVDRPDPAGASDPVAHAQARARGVIHRDVSPQNLLLSYEGAVKVSDFGLAKVRAASGCVRSDTVRGKPSYMSPEQVSGEPLDGRSDLYAAGVMLWEMLADRPLFTGTAKEITAQVMFKSIGRPSTIRSSVPADLEAVAMTLLAHDRADRYPTAEAAIEALLCCADVPRDGRGELAQLLGARFPTAARSRGPRKTAAGEPRAQPGGPTTVAAPPSVVRPASSASQLVVRPRRRVFAATAGMVLCVLIAVAVLMRGEIAQSRPPDPERSPVAAAPGHPAAMAPSAPPAPPPPAPRVPATAADSAPGDGGASPARHPEGAPPRSAPRRERVTATGELAIIVRPWAMIWLNGKPSGQTPFRAAVPAGRYRVRLANDDVGHDEVTTVTVEPDRTATVERHW